MQDKSGRPSGGRPTPRRIVKVGDPGSGHGALGKVVGRRKLL
jgi:hypothetical protein